MGLFQLLMALPLLLQPDRQLPPAGLQSPPAPAGPPPLSLSSSNALASSNADMAELSSLCSCQLAALDDLDKLHTELVRVRIESSDLTSKFEPNASSITSLICGSRVLYTRTTSEPIESLTTTTNNNNNASNTITTLISSRSPLAKKTCRVCTLTGWSHSEACGSRLTCDRDALRGQPSLVPLSESASLVIGSKQRSQTLFLPGQVLAEYIFRGVKSCKRCEPSGEWSKFAVPLLCHVNPPPAPQPPAQQQQQQQNNNKLAVNSRPIAVAAAAAAAAATVTGCRYADLRAEERRTSAYVRVRIESPDGLERIAERTINDDDDDDIDETSNETTSTGATATASVAAADTLVVYQTFLVNMSLSKKSQSKLWQSSSNLLLATMPKRTLTVRACRRCLASTGRWSDLAASCDTDTNTPSLYKCDRSLLTGEPRIQASPFSVRNYKPLLARQTLYEPGSVLAVYTFGRGGVLDGVFGGGKQQQQTPQPTKFCKQCQDNGEWSYAMSELCSSTPLTATTRTTTTTTTAPSASIFQQQAATTTSDEMMHAKKKKRRQRNWAIRAGLSAASERYVQALSALHESRCTMRSLSETEAKTGGNVRRVYVVSADRKLRLRPSRQALIPSRSLAIYTNSTTNSSNNGSSEQQQQRVCSMCLNGAWTPMSVDCLHTAGGGGGGGEVGETHNNNNGRRRLFLHFCHRDEVSFDDDDRVAKIKVLSDDEQSGGEHEQVAPGYQELFEPGRARIVYADKSSEDGSGGGGGGEVCRTCAWNGERAEWSRYASASQCGSKRRIMASLGTDTPSQQEEEEEDNGGEEELCISEPPRNDANYSLESIQTTDARRYLSEPAKSNTSASTSTPFVAYPSGSVAVYKRNGGGGVKWCRRCSMMSAASGEASGSSVGQWEAELTPCLMRHAVSKCRLRDARSPDFFVRTRDTLRLDEDDVDLGEQLVFPAEVMAVYEFGAVRYCKMCHSNGTWSAYPDRDVCKMIKWT